MKNYIVITGGAGFVGSNLIEHLLKETNKKIISLDNYSSGKIINHIKNKRVTYLKGETILIYKILSSYKRKFIHYSISVNLLEFFKVLKNLMIVISQTPSDLQLFLISA